MGELSELFDRLGSDKGSKLDAHEYADTYEALIPRDARHIVEIGIGTEFEFNGSCGSIRAWLEWAPDATVWGFDFQSAPDDLMRNRRFRFFWGNQGVQQDLDNFRGMLPMVDAIIDDGSHHHDHQIATFRTLFPRVRLGGLYAIEEWSLRRGSGPTPAKALGDHPCFVRFFGRQNEGMLFLQRADLD